MKKLTIFITLIAVTFVEVMLLYASSVGPNGPSTVVSSLTGACGTAPWSNPTNATTSNNIYATSSFAAVDGGSELLKTTNYGFSVPTSATINGIQVEVQRKGSNAGKVADCNTYIVKGGNIAGTVKLVSSDLPTSEAYITYGNSTDLWGTTWAPADVNSSTFGVGYSTQLGSTWGPFDSIQTAYVDYVRISVYYTISANSKGTTIRESKIQVRSGKVRIQP